MFFVGERFFLLSAQNQGIDFGFRFFNPANINLSFLFYTLLALLIVTLLIAYGVYRYQRWKNFQVFVEEMKALDLTAEHEAKFSAIVKRYHMKEPVQVLYSLRLFDEIAMNEMIRALGSPASSKAKANFIDTVYSIRGNVYFPHQKDQDALKEN